MSKKWSGSVIAEVEVDYSRGRGWQCASERERPGANVVLARVRPVARRESLSEPPAGAETDWTVNCSHVRPTTAQVRQKLRRGTLCASQARRAANPVRPSSRSASLPPGRLRPLAPNDDRPDDIHARVLLRDAGATCVARG